MNLEKINEAARNNFFNHIELSKNSEFFRKYDKEFFKDLNIDSPFIDKEKILEKLVETKILYNLNLDDNYKNSEFFRKHDKDLNIDSNIDSPPIDQEKMLEKLVKTKYIYDLELDENTIKFIKKISEKEKERQIKDIDPQELKMLEEFLLSDEKILSKNKPPKLKV